MMNTLNKLTRTLLFSGSIVLLLVACGGSEGNIDDLFADDPTATPVPSPVATPTPAPVPTATPSPVPTATPTPVPTPTPVAFSSVQAIFANSCQGCHSPGGFAAGTGLFLDTATNSFSGLVGVASSAAAGETRVIASDPNNSYLIKKLEGAAGIAGSRMPLGGSPLSASQITTIRTWIGQGALQDASVESATKVIRSILIDEAESPTFVFSLSGPIDPSSLTAQTAQIYLHNGDYRDPAPAEDITLELIDNALVVSYVGDQSFELLDLRINDPAFSAVTDILGRRLDADSDGVEGGILQQTYPIDF